MWRQIRFSSIPLVLVLIGLGCSTRSQAGPQTVQATGAAGLIHTLTLADYPPAGAPYYVERSDLWLVHTPEGRLLAFAPVSPDYGEQITVDECRFAWSESVQRFIDPCSGDDWELDGRLNMIHSTELWSNRDLDQYALTVEDGLIYVHLSQKKPGPLRVEAQAP
jgi:hypothetical protein